MTRIKICGITNLEDALLAADLGVDALGFVFSKSPRRVEADVAEGIINQLPPFLSSVGVFADEPDEIVKHVARRCKLNIIQLHGDEEPDYLKNFHRKIIKAFRIKTETDLIPIPTYKAQAYLLDSRVEGKKGGSGVTFDWNLAIKAKKYGRIILSGGLTSENVTEAIQKVLPYAVDVSSGIETSPGKKDSAKLKAFVEAVRRA